MLQDGDAKSLLHRQDSYLPWTSDLNICDRNLMQGLTGIVCMCDTFLTSHLHLWRQRYERNYQRPVVYLPVQTYRCQVAGHPHR
jgi:hypothetical protein